MDIIKTNSGNTFDKKLNLTFNLYTEYKNDSIVVNYGDSQQNDYFNLISGTL